MTLKLGIITPTFNRPQLLEELHFSLALTDPTVDWCHYVIDDGSESDYSETLSRCKKATGRLKISRIENQGPLIARNRAIDFALEDECTHLCFVDDDDEVLPKGLISVSRRIQEFPDVCWYMFGSHKGASCDDEWPDNPIEVSWITDVVIGKKYGSDSLIVLSSNLIGKTRFSKRGRNQREWTFFLDIAKKRDGILLCPEIVQKTRYQPGGLTDQARSSEYSLEQIGNNIERSIRYWMLKPSSKKLIMNVLKQVFTAPVKLLLAYFGKADRSLKAS